MAYTTINFKSKKAVKQAIADAQAAGQPGVRAFQPGPFGPDLADGSHSFEGPHYPRPHSWYGSGVVRDGYLISLK